MRRGPVHFGVALAVALVEAALLGGALLTDHFMIAVGIAAGFLYFLLAIRFPEVACMVLWCAIPLSIELPVSGTAISVPSEPLLALFLCGWGVRTLRGRRPPRIPRDVAVPLTLFGLVALTSSLFSDVTWVGLKALSITSMYAAFGLLAFRSLPCTESRQRRWSDLVVASGGLVSFYGTVRVLSGQGSLATLSYGIGRPFYAEHGTYAAYLALLVPLTLLYVFESRGRARLCYLASLSAQIAGLILSFTRAAWLSMLVVIPAVIVVWFLWRRSARPILLPVGGIAIIIVLLLAPGSESGSQLGKRVSTITDAQNVSNLERVNRWIAGVEMVKAHPLIGVGYNGYVEEYRRYRRKLIWTPQAFTTMGSHNELLQMLCETGILGFASGMWFFVAVARRGWRAFRAGPSDQTRTIALGVLGGLATYAIHGLFNAYQVDKITFPLWVGIGVLIAISLRSDAAGGVSHALPKPA